MLKSFTVSIFLLFYCAILREVLGMWKVGVRLERGYEMEKEKTVYKAFFLPIKLKVVLFISMFPLSWRFSEEEGGMKGGYYLLVEINSLWLVYNSNVLMWLQRVVQNLNIFEYSQIDVSLIWFMMYPIAFEDLMCLGQ